MDNTRKTTQRILIAVILILLAGAGVVYAGIRNNWWQPNSQPTNGDNLPIEDLVTPTPTPTTSITPTTTTSSTPTPTPTATPLPTIQTYTVKVYFSKHPDSDDDPSKVFAVQRESNTLGVATFAIKELIKGPTSSESSQGYYSAITGYLNGTSNCSGADFAISLNKRGTVTQNGTATLWFCRSVSIPGELAGARMQTEMKSTLLQFKSIKDAVILTKDGNCFNDLSGLNLCLHTPTTTQTALHIQPLLP